MNFLITEFSMIDVYLQKQPLELLYKKKAALKHFAKFTGKQLCQSLFLNKIAGLRPVTWVNFAKFLRIPFLQNTSGCFCLCICEKQPYNRDVWNMAMFRSSRPSCRFYGTFWNSWFEVHVKMDASKRLLKQSIIC